MAALTATRLGVRELPEDRAEREALLSGLEVLAGIIVKQE